MRGGKARRVNLLFRQCTRDAVDDELGVAFVIDVLELATAACAEMAAWRDGAMRAGNQDTIRVQYITRRRTRRVTPVSCYTVTPRGKANNRRTAHFRGGRR